MGHTLPLVQHLWAPRWVHLVPFPLYIRIARNVSNQNNPQKSNIVNMQYIPYGQSSAKHRGDSTRGGVTFGRGFKESAVVSLTVSRS